jgi:hypothetical protein
MLLMKTRRASKNERLAVRTMVQLRAAGTMKVRTGAKKESLVFVKSLALSRWHFSHTNQIKRLMNFTVAAGDGIKHVFGTLQNYNRNKEEVL